MPRMKLCRVAPFICALSALACQPGGGPPKREASAQRPQPARSSGPTERFVSVADLHFDPLADPALLPQLQAAEPSAWRAIFEASRDSEAIGTSDTATSDTGPLPADGADTNFALFDSALRSMQIQHSSEAETEAVFVLVVGDLLTTDLRARFEAATAASESGSESQPDPNTAEAEYRAFVDKATRFVVAELSAAFEGAPIFPVVGEADSYCGAYHLAPAGAYLRDAAATWGPALAGRDSAGNPTQTFAQTFARGGYYEVELPRTAGGRLIVLNSVFFSPEYDPSCPGEPPSTGSVEEPIEGQLEWLSEALRRAREADETVWLAYHLPPGPGLAHAAADPDPNHLALCEPPPPLWNKGLLAAVAALRDEYSDIITASFAAHLHIDGQRLSGLHAGDLALTHLSPALSPRLGNNPGYQVIEFDSGLGTLVDYRTHILDRRADSASETAEPRWQIGPRFSAPAEIERYDADAVQHLLSRASQDEATRATYLRELALGGATKELGLDDWPAYWCAAQGLVGRDFTDCYCADSAPTATSTDGP